MTDGDQHNQVVEKARAGDQDAFREIVKLYSRRIHGIAYHLTGSSEDARDITQEVFIRLHRSLVRYDSQFLFSTWLYRVTVNLTIDSLRKTDRHRHEDVDMTGEIVPLQDNSPQPDMLAERAEFRGAIKRLTGKLAIKQRQVFVLRDLQGFAVSEVADILKCGQSTVRVHLARARGHIREALATQYPEYAGGDQI